MPHLHDTTRYADISHIMPLQGKNVLSPYTWVAPWPRNQGDVTLEALRTEARNAVLKEVMKVFNNYKSVQARPPRRY